MQWNICLGPKGPGLICLGLRRLVARLTSWRINLMTEVGAWWPIWLRSEAVIKNNVIHYTLYMPGSYAKSFMNQRFLSWNDVMYILSTRAGGVHDWTAPEASILRKRELWNLVKNFKSQIQYRSMTIPLADARPPPPARTSLHII